MPRRSLVSRRIFEPDARYNNVTITRLIKHIMGRGKKSTAERVVYETLDIVGARENQEPVVVMERAIKNITPLLEVKPRRVGGATYQVPVEVAPERGLALAMRWLVSAARAKSGKAMAERLASEVLDAAKEQGVAVKKKEDTHRMAEANRAFAHYRW
jgi:small subunit ribosomal protein S7